MRKILLLMLVTVFAFSSCKKYEDDPSMSLRSAQARLVGEWEVEQLRMNGTDATTEFFTYRKYLKMFFKKNGTYEHNDNGKAKNGTWELNSAKDKIITTINNESKTRYITRLTNKEFRFYQMDGIVKVEYYLKKNK